MPTCTECNAEKPTDAFYDRCKKQGGKHRSCRECMDYWRWTRRLIEATFPKPRGCYLCGAENRRLEIEHCHEAAKEQDPVKSYLGHACHSWNIRKRRKIGGFAP